MRGATPTVTILPSSSALAAIAGLAACSAATMLQGAVSEYTSFAAWSGISGSSVIGTETFAAYSGVHAGAQVGTQGSVGWTIASNPGIAFGTNTSLGSTVVSSYSPAAAVEVTWSHPTGLSGIGGNLFVAYINFVAAPRTLFIDVTLADSTVHSFSRVDPVATDFWGFHSTGAFITGITLNSTSEFPTVGNLSFMTGGAAIPLPGAADLAAAGLMGQVRRRRR